MIKMVFSLKKAVGFTTTLGFIVLVTCASFSNVTGICPMGMTASVEKSVDSELSPCHQSSKENNDQAGSEGNCCEENEVSVVSIDTFFKDNVVVKPQLEPIPLFSFDFHPNDVLVFSQLSTADLKAKPPYFHSHHLSLLQVFLI
ncbi:hypothetical protein [Leptospira ilyithenensis]|uniref:Uncharacterized protein n=1 Tax=Leptospira ilyithenensis TaxID=2484901 RepID=A0A4R9LRI4_9LEPT|nr:hypothetical protein [Leptospira ilyithenensis]TGN13354.1 hypothetical protein EHS11_03740 [Leptospira ilyithenensis]